MFLKFSYISQKKDFTKLPLKCNLFPVFHVGPQNMVSPPLKPCQIMMQPRLEATYLRARAIVEAGEEVVRDRRGAVRLHGLLAQKHRA